MATLSVHEAVRELYISLTALLFNLLFLWFLQLQGYQHLPSKRAFRDFTLMVAVANFTSCVKILFQVSDLKVPPVLTVTLSVFVTMTNHLMLLFFSIYFVRFFGSLEQRDYDIPVLSYLIAVVKSLVMGVWLAWAVLRAVRTGERVGFSPLMSIVFGYGFNMYHIAYCFVFFLRKHRILRRRVRYAATAGFLVVMSTIILQTLIGSVPHVYYLGATVALLVFYFDMESRPASELVVPQAVRPGETGRIDDLSYDSEGLKQIDGFSNGDEFERIAVHTNDVFEKNTDTGQKEADRLRKTMEEAERKANEMPEKAGTLTKEEAILRVRRITPQLLSDYRALAGILEPYFGASGENAERDADLPEIDPEELAELYEAILEFSELYDLETIESLLEQVKGYAIPEAERERFAKVKESVSVSDWSGLRAVLE